jgi:hypothetical protein
VELEGVEAAEAAAEVGVGLAARGYDLTIGSLEVPIDLVVLGASEDVKGVGGHR